MDQWHLMKSVEEKIGPALTARASSRTAELGKCLANSPSSYPPLPFPACGVLLSSDRNS